MGNLITGGVAVDDRGSVRFVNDFNFAEVKRFYQVENHRAGFIRAWHGHEKENKYVYVVKGSALIGVVPLYSSKVETFILSSVKPQILFIPNGNYNGFKTLEEGTIIQFFSTSTLEESLEDDIRLNYDYFEEVWDENPR
jgi:dTDP-4-dehydrorhamnose 3,5-epimerase